MEFLLGEMEAATSFLDGKRFGETAYGFVQLLCQCRNKGKVLDACNRDNPPKCIVMSI